MQRLLIASLILGVGVGRAGADTPAQRGLAFIDKDAAKWRQEKKCATCHHGTMTVWTLSEARSLGYPIPPDRLAETATWTSERLKDIDKPRDTRPGWKMVNTPALYLSLMALADPGQTVISQFDLKRIAGHLLRHQEADGSWAWSSAPPKNRPPPVFESDEIATLLGCLAVGPFVGPAKEQAPYQDSLDKAREWLAKTRPADSTQALALRLLRDVKTGATAKQIEAGIAQLVQRQHKDGGWAPEEKLPSDAYATGQALYFLRLAGLKKDHEAIRRGVAFLATTQRADGSWPMKSRAHPGATPMTNPVPITYFGSAWATLGLLRSVDPPPFDLFARDNLAAWCIVPFDAKKRGPEERVAMLKKLGFKHYAYDWRAEHLPTFDKELSLLKKEGITLDAVWFPAGLNQDARTILNLLDKHKIRTQLWITMGDPAPNAREPKAKVAAAADQLRPIAEEAVRLGCTVALYNHGSWFGEPENQLAIIDHLNLANVGIVYNLHHGHDHLDRFPAMLKRMLPHLYAFNVNGMVEKGDRIGKKILPLGVNPALDLKLLRALRDSGYRGPVGILGHTGDDVELRLLDNLDGLEWLRPQLAGKAASPPPKLRTYSVK